MYYYLTEQIHRKFIAELREYWSYHPRFKDIVQHIEGKYSFKARPQKGIVIRNSSGNHVRLAADNFQGHVMSYAFLAHYEGTPNLSVEWIREDYVAIQQNNGFFPTAPGIYFLDFRNANGVPTDQAFYIDPLLVVTSETLLQINATQYQLLRSRYHAGSLRLFRMPGNLLLYEGANYTGNPETGEIDLLEPLQEGEFLSADYRTPGDPTGPWQVFPDRALREPIPGVVLAFGKRITAGDRLAVVVSETRDISALEFGGRWDLTLDFDVIARDPLEQREILDQSMMYLMTVARPRLSSQGIEIIDISTGGETEDIYDEAAEDFYYNGSFNVQIQTDWSIHVPLGIVIRGVEPGGGEPTPQGQAPLTVPFIQQIAGLSDAEIARIQTNFRVLASLGLRAPWDYFYNGKRGRPGVYGTGEGLL